LSKEPPSTIGKGARLPVLVIPEKIIAFGFSALPGDGSLKKGYIK
jgi:hypothetical protein